MEAVSPIDDIIRVMEKRFGKKLEVTSKIRSAHAQAKAMFPHFETDSTTISSYASHKKPWIEEIRKAFKAGKAKNEFPTDIVRRMSTVIDIQIANNKLISNHLSNSARDIRVRNFSSQEISTLVALLKGVREIVVLDETKTAQPHIHIHLK